MKHNFIPTILFIVVALSLIKLFLVVRVITYESDRNNIIPPYEFIMYNRSYQISAYKHHAINITNNINELENVILNDMNNFNKTEASIMLKK